MAFVVGPYSLYAMRFILGAAEAGFFPGAILYLTYWLPSQYRARILATFTVSIPLATFLGSPLSVTLLQLDGAFGLHGWQWLFISRGRADDAARRRLPVRAHGQAGAGEPGSRRSSGSG